MKRTALVTGANRGIGREVARQLADLGLRVIVTARDPKQATETARAIGGDAYGVRLDVTDPTSIAQARAEIETHAPGVDVLVNNAAILLDENGDLLEIAIDRFRETLETNVLGAIAVAQAFVPGMVQRRYGRVVNVSSGAGQLSSMSDYAPPYSISKAALNAFTRQLAAATNGAGVLVNCASPGWVRTDMGGRNAPRSVREGADTLVWLATLPDDGPTGGFYADRHRIDW